MFPGLAWNGMGNFLEHRDACIWSGSVEKHGGLLLCSENTLIDRSDVVGGTWYVRCFWQLLQPWCLPPQCAL